jgi:hypothetical protein
MAGKKTLDELKAELKSRGIEFDEKATYDELEALLQKEMDKPKDKRPKKKIKRIVAGKPVELPYANEVPHGIRTTQDHEQRITALEIACGIKKVITDEVEEK